MTTCKEPHPTASSSARPPSPDTSHYTRNGVSLNDRIRKLQEEHDRLKACSTVVTTRNEQLLRDAVAANAKAKAAEVALTDLTNRHHMCQQSEEQLQAELETMSATATYFETENHRHMLSFFALRAKHAGDLQALTERASTLELENERLRMEMDASNLRCRELAQMNDDYDRLRMEMDATSDLRCRELAQANEDNVRLRTDMDASVMLCRVLQSANKELLFKRDELLDNNRQLIRENTRLQENIQNSAPESGPVPSPDLADPQSLGATVHNARGSTPGDTGAIRASSKILSDRKSESLVECS